MTTVRSCAETCTHLSERCFYDLNPATKFLPNWHIQVIASALEACRRGEIKRLIINQSAALSEISVRFSRLCWFLLGHDPTAQIICSSYGQELANKHAVGLSYNYDPLLVSGIYFHALGSRSQRQARAGIHDDATGFSHYRPPSEAS